MSAEPTHRLTAAGAVVLDDAGRVLLQRRADNGRWALPGGQVEVGETVREAVVRETIEETGIVVEVQRLIGVYSDPEQTTRQYPDGSICAYVCVCFLCRPLRGALTTSEESTEVAWFALDALPENISDAHRIRLADALAGGDAHIR